VGNSDIHGLAEIQYRRPESPHRDADASHSFRGPRRALRVVLDPEGEQAWRSNSHTIECPQKAR